MSWVEIMKLVYLVHVRNVEARRRLCLTYIPGNILILAVIMVATQCSGNGSFTDTFLLKH